MEKVRYIRIFIVLILIVIILAACLNGNFPIKKTFNTGYEFANLKPKKVETNGSLVTPVRKVELFTDKKTTTDCKPMVLGFLNSSHPNFKTKVALYSYPGSGNTWLRHLIQEATGFYTGSVFHDQTLYQQGFRGELHNIRDGSCVVYKTHGMKKHWDKAVVLLRSPFYSFRAFFNFRKLRFSDMMRHVGYANEESFHQAGWRLFVKNQIVAWKEGILQYLKVFKGPVHLLLYEDLQDNLIGTMELLVKFLNLTPDPKNLSCMYYNQEGQHHRKPRNGTSISEIYDKEMVALINSAIKTVSATVANRFPNKFFHIMKKYKVVM